MARCVPGRVAVGVRTLVEHVQRGHDVGVDGAGRAPGLLAGVIARVPGGGVQDGEGDDAGAATAGDGGGLHAGCGHQEFDGVGGVHMLPGMQESDVADPVSLAVLGDASGAQILQRSGEPLEFGHRGRRHSQGLSRKAP